MAQKWATGGTLKGGSSYPKGRKVVSFADGGFVGGLAAGVQAGLNAGDGYTSKKRKWKNPFSKWTEGTTGSDGQPTAASSTSTDESASSSSSSSLKPEGNES